MLPLQEVWVQSLVRELRPPHATRLGQKRKKKINFDFLSISVLELSVLCLVKSLFFFSKVITASMDMSLSKLWGMVKDREAWRTTDRGVAKSQTQLSD